jgi:hypothetical protein
LKNHLCMGVENQKQNDDLLDFANGPAQTMHAQIQRNSSTNMCCNKPPPPHTHTSTRIPYPISTGPLCIITHLAATCMAACAATTTGTGSAVLNTTLRPRLSSRARRQLLQATKPPSAPTALLKVPMCARRGQWSTAWGVWG